MHLRGAPALSVFRLEQLERRLRELAPTLARVRAEYVHFADVGQPLGERGTVLDAILNYGNASPAEWTETGQLLLVIPRPGTISPWSSKATDIAHNCGLSMDCLSTRLHCRASGRWSTTG